MAQHARLAPAGAALRGWRHGDHRDARRERLGPQRHRAGLVAQSGQRSDLHRGRRTRRCAAGRDRAHGADARHRLDPIGAGAQCARPRRRAGAAARAHHVAHRSRTADGPSRDAGRRARETDLAAGADDRLLRCGAPPRPGAVECDQRRERRQHGLPRLRPGHHRLVSGGGARRVVRAGRLPRGAGRRRDRRHRHRDHIRSRSALRCREAAQPGVAARRDDQGHLFGRQRAAARSGAAACHHRHAELAHFGLRAVGPCGQPSDGTGGALRRRERYNPAYTMVCRIAKQWLPPVRPASGGPDQ